MGVDELADAGMPLETLVWRLFNEEDEVRVLASTPLVRGCRCSPDYIAQVLAKFPPEEQREMADEKGVIRDRKSVVSGKSVSVLVVPGGRRNNKKKHKHSKQLHHSTN